MLISSLVLLELYYHELVLGITSTSSARNDRVTYNNNEEDRLSLSPILEDMSEVNPGHSLKYQSIFQLNHVISKPRSVCDRLISKEWNSEFTRRFIRLCKLLPQVTNIKPTLSSSSSMRKICNKTDILNLLRFYKQSDKQWLQQTKSIKLNTNLHVGVHDSLVHLINNNNSNSNDVTQT
ncbi:unnamed protein product [Schistosoma rodhaini]|nr:unnamed protein product [Schistosoma rodhaini]